MHDFVQHAAQVMNPHGMVAHRVAGCGAYESELPQCCCLSQQREKSDEKAGDMKIAASCEAETTEISGMVDNNERFRKLHCLGMVAGTSSLPPSLHWPMSTHDRETAVHIDAAQDFVSVLEKCM